jgi:hypothetical protein
MRTCLVFGKVTDPPELCCCVQAMLSLQDALGIHFLDPSSARTASMVLALLAARCGPMVPVMCEDRKCSSAADGVGLTSNLHQLQQPSSINIACTGQNARSAVCWVAVCDECLQRMDLQKVPTKVGRCMSLALCIEVLCPKQRGTI